jgi:hypothetical protein
MPTREIRSGRLLIREVLERWRNTWQLSDMVSSRQSRRTGVYCTNSFSGTAASAGRLSRHRRTEKASRLYCALATAGVAVLMLSTAVTVHADPQPAEAQPNPYPDITYYDHLDAEDFAIPDVDGVWFLAPTGQSCGIWYRGNFGCAGDIPGAPPGTSHIGWVNGARAIHYDWTLAVSFPSTQAQRPLPPRSFIEYQGTTCAVTPDTRTYCERGPYRFVIEPTRTWLQASSVDWSWMELGPVTGQPSDTRR